MIHYNYFSFNLFIIICSSLLINNSNKKCCYNLKLFQREIRGHLCLLLNLLSFKQLMILAPLVTIMLLLYIKMVWTMVILLSDKLGVMESITLSLIHLIHTINFHSLYSEWMKEQKLTCILILKKKLALTFSGFIIKYHHLMESKLQSKTTSSLKWIHKIFIRLLEQLIAKLSVFNNQMETGTISKIQLLAMLNWLQIWWWWFETYFWRFIMLFKMILKKIQNIQAVEEYRQPLMTGWWR